MVFPLTESMYDLRFIVIADLTETQRELFTPTLIIRGHSMLAYTGEAVRATFMELFCMPKSTVDCPNLRTSGGSRVFCALDQGELYEGYSYWAEDEDTG